jgi:hypothetical protein
MSIVKTSLVIVFGLVAAISVHGQATKTPFSTFGIGESFGNALANNQGMGGIGVSQPQFWYVNNQNPALLIYNVRTSFHAGVVGEQRKITADTINQTSVGGNLNYLVTAFPVKFTKWSTSLGLSPLTSVNYKVGYTEVINGSDDHVEIAEEGSGGLSQFSWSNGVRLTNQLAVGLRASYVFGSIVNTYKNKIIESTQPANFVAAIEERSYVRDFIFSAGVSYSLDSIFRKRNHRLSFGAVYDFAGDLKTRKRNVIFRTDASGDLRIDPDTLVSSKGFISLPSGFTAGVSLSKGVKWSMGTEFTYRDWSGFRSVSKDDEGLGKAWKIALGGERTPDLFAADNYFKRITYRAGLSIEEYPFLANNKKMQDLGINFGVSLPAGISSLDLSFRYGKRGNKNDNLIEESYFRVFFGISFNDDKWFIKRKFD